MSEVSATQWFITGAISALGLFCAAGYWAGERRRLQQGGVRRNPLLADPRPWRGVGAAIVALLAVMFFLGINFATPRASPRAYALFWLMMLLLLLWLCSLAWVDIRHTRRLALHQLSRARVEIDSEPVKGRCDGEEI